ncbi:iron-sulfur cluster assembly scaffold protein [Sandarakinorhabdus oryzae]|uniref:iron-sulfur cluster assembly scaffold protein n=1 Tax=Sandarakinorhabdus oryzae TaxID=2675220 RepID=UPI0012E230EE|nr:iron-sulfur cluster assembly scaffold protein [Sandarakinorhabdus oryzae]
MSEALYNAAILRLKLAGETAHRLAAADGSATRVSPVCGSKIIADVALDPNGRVAAVGLDATKACTLGQASATVVLERAIGLDVAALAATRTQLADFLAGRAESAPEGWAMFAPARAHRARHPSILLALDAVLAALAEAGQRAA